MQKIEIVPLSVNKAFQGKRFKTPAYKKFERDCLLLLPKIKIPAVPLEVHYIFGFSSVLSDIGNPEKLVTDILCKKYGFDDRFIYKMTIEKCIVDKGKEFIEFKISHYATATN